MAISTILACLFFLFPFANSQIPFIFQGFNDTELTLEGASIIKPTGLLRLTNKSENVIGHAFYSQPIQLFNTTSSNASSFSTNFVFAIVPSSSSSGGYGLAFTLAPSTSFSGAGTDHYLGLFNSSNDGNPSNHIFAVEFDTVKGYNEKVDSEGNHVGININSMNSNASAPASYFKNGTKVQEEVTLQSGDPICAWIEYDGVNKFVNVTISPLYVDKPNKPLISESIDLTHVLDKERMYVGFSASTGKKSSSHYILGWSFAINEPAPALKVSQLPKPPKENNSSSKFQPEIKVILIVLSVVMLVGIFIFYILFKRMRSNESLEEWELDCPHRFSQNDLVAATKGFKDSEIIGVGGFGAVYRGVLPHSGCEIAVKKVTRNSIQGMREFAAEIESLGRLRHKNLVNLQGWCKKKNNLLIVYDYIPNGSLDTLLYHPKPNFVLNWEQRFSILKGIAAGLLYLHEEWEQVVIHRDVKPSNVLIDSGMNARLSDFGLARLYDHGEMSRTTSVVGTIGYIAPELARTGKASKSTDIFAFGVLLLEVASGKRPLDLEQFILVDWVMNCHQMGRILDAADPKLDCCFDVEEMELVLQLGLLCSHQKPEARPSTRQVVRCLNGDDHLPVVVNWVDSESNFDTNSGFSEVLIFSDLTRSYHSSSIGAFSSNSMDNGR